MATATVGSARAQVAKDVVPPGFQTLPVTSSAQRVVARKGDVYYVVTEQPGRLPKDAVPIVVVDQLMPEIEGDVHALWEPSVGAPSAAVRVMEGHEPKGQTALIGARGGMIRLVLCQWGVGSAANAAEAKAARNDCRNAMDPAQFDQPWTGEVPFTPPEGYARGVSHGGALWQGQNGRQMFLASQAGDRINPAMELQALTAKVDGMFTGSQLTLNQITPDAIEGAPVVRVRGKVASGGDDRPSVLAFLIPRENTTLLLSLTTPAEPTAADEKVLRDVAASVVEKPASAREGTGAGAIAAVRAADEKERSADRWKAAALFGGLGVAVVAVLILLRALSLRAARRRRATRS